MGRKQYRPRLIDAQVVQYLRAFGAICIEGVKFSGKTMTSLHHSKSSFDVGSPFAGFSNRILALTDPLVILEGETPRLIDEWQEVPAIWDAVRYEVDQREGKGHFILTGSSTPPYKGVYHSGAGRIAKLRMRPMSLFEMGVSSGLVSLKGLFDGEFESQLTGDVALKEIIKLILQGGWPGSLDETYEDAKLLPKTYIEALIDNDLQRVDGRSRNMNKIQLLLRSLARNESSTATNRALKNDIKAEDDEDIDVETVADYLNIFDRLFLTENQMSFSPHLRSSVPIKKAVKRHFADPSLACALLMATEESLLADMETLGFLFEALCERDLRVYAEVHDAQLYHYQDYDNNEIDAIVQMSDGCWGAFEIKLGVKDVDKAAHNLLRITELIERNPKGRPPKVMAIITGLSNAAYRRPDGVYVLPITALRE